MKEISSEEEEIGISKCIRISRVDIMNKEVKGWTSSSKQKKSFYRNNKHQRGDLFRTDERKGKKSSPRMG